MNQELSKTTQSVDALYLRVTSAILSAEELGRAVPWSAETRAAWSKVSAVEAEIASLTPAGTPEAAVARSGAVTAALRAKEYARAIRLAADYWAVTDPEAVSTVIEFCRAIQDLEDAGGHCRGRALAAPEKNFGQTGGKPDPVPHPLTLREETPSMTPTPVCLYTDLDRLCTRLADVLVEHVSGGEPAPLVARQLSDQALDIAIAIALSPHAAQLAALGEWIIAVSCRLGSLADVPRHQDEGGVTVATRHPSHARRATA
jgi:hypothetical protein